MSQHNVSNEALGIDARGIVGRYNTTFTGDLEHDMAQVRAVAQAGPYQPQWSSLCKHAAPSWFSKAKFGIFTHWGLYTVPEYRNEWYSRNMYIQGYPEFDHHRETFGDQKTNGYQSFINRFTAPKFDAQAWIKVFKDAGAQYYMPVAEHHDGYQMYASALSKYNAAETGPHRDIIAQLRSAALAEGLHFATSNHRAEHWWFMGHGKEFDSDVHEPLQRGDFYWPAMPEPDNQDLHSEPKPTQEYTDDWVCRVCEIIDAYRPELLYFDWWVQHESFKQPMQLVAAYYYNRAAQWGMEVSVCYKDDGMAWGAGIADVERGGFAATMPFAWQTDTAIARNSWCYTDSLDYKTVPELVATLIDTVSKNGNLLLNVGPRADGSIAEKDAQILHEIGQWLGANGEGIYDSLPWKISGEGPTKVAAGSFSDGSEQVWTAQDWRFTSKDGTIYAFCLNPDGLEQLSITSMFDYHDGQRSDFHGIVKDVRQLGVGSVPWQRDSQALCVTPRYGKQNERYQHMPVGFAIDIY